MKSETFRELERISRLSEGEIALNVIKREIRDDPGIAKLYCKAYSGIASLFSEGSKEKDECLRIIRTVREILGE